MINISNIPNILIGATILIAGRKLFWLFVGCLGFLVGFTYAERFMGPQPEYMVIGMGIILGIIMACFAIFLQKFTVALCGFMAGGFITLHIFDITKFGDPHYLWLFCLIGGILGTLLISLIFDWALVILSVILGSSLIVRSISLAPDIRLWVYLFLLVLGVAIQAKLMESKSGRSKKRKNVRVAR